MSKQDPKTTVRLYERTHDALLFLYGAPKTQAADRAVQALLYVRSTALSGLIDRFSESEIKVLLDAHADIIMMPHLMCREVLKATLEKAEVHKGVASKKGIDLEILSNKLDEISQERIFFLLDEVQRAWKTDEPFEALKYLCHDR